MPRAGTTIVERIISSHLAISGAGELSSGTRLGSSFVVGHLDITQEAVLDFRLHYLSAPKYVSGGKLIVTDKTPQNIFI